MYPGLIAIGAVLLVVVLLGMMALTEGTFLPLYAMVLIPAAVLVCVRPGLLLAGSIAMFASNITLPLLHGNSLMLHHIVGAAFVCALIPYRIMKWRKKGYSTLSKKLLLMFAAVLAITMGVRGTGVRALGSSLWGGGMYIILLIVCGMYLAQDIIHLSPRTWKRTLILMVTLSFLPLLAQLLYVGSGGSIQQQYLFISPQGSNSILRSLEALETETGVARFNTGTAVLVLMIPLCMMSNPFRGLKSILTVIIIVATIFVAGLSGSRFAILEVCGFLVIWSGLQKGKVRPAAMFGFVFLIMVGVSIAAAFADNFPLSVQRSISFVPFANVSEEASLDAGQTLIWRLDLWKAAIGEIPSYWLVGRGVAFEYRKLMEICALGLYERDWGLLTGSYHNAVLSFLINLGIAGLISGLGFIIAIVRRHLYVELKAEWNDDFLQNAHRFLVAVFCSHGILFLTLGGDVQSFAPVIFYAILLDGLVASNKAIPKRDPPPPGSEEPAFRTVRQDPVSYV